MTAYKPREPFPGVGKDYNGPPMTAELYRRLEAEWYREQDAAAWEAEQSDDWRRGRSEGNVAAHRQQRLLTARITDAAQQVRGLTVAATSQQIGVRCETGGDGTPKRLDLGRQLGSHGGDTLIWAWSMCAYGYDKRIRAVLELLAGVEDFGAKFDDDRLTPPSATSMAESNGANKEVFDRLMTEAAVEGRSGEGARQSLRKYPNRHVILPFVARSSRHGVFTIQLDGTLLPVAVAVPGFSDVENVKLCQLMRHLGLVARRERKTIMERAVKGLQGFDGLRPGAPDTAGLLTAPETSDWPLEDEAARDLRERWLSDLKLEINRNEHGGNPV
ncbi:MAG: hypothetical protein ACRC20_03685 [Segniliparus sp.]|uniref:hypothetical protein n=1 Tax=Segniliparus sp. TaxID=2804064 RepID=UPI003F2AE366